MGERNASRDRVGEIANKSNRTKINSRNVKVRKQRNESQQQVTSKEMLQATLLKKRECNRRAQMIVERLLEVNVPEEWFLGSLQYISESHFQDAVEERALTKLCGYPLCRGQLQPAPAQQFHISTRRNKVYDITDRKNFCSNRCYAAAKFLKQQLLTSPLWLRDKEEMPVFTIMPAVSPSEGVGEELDFSIEKVMADKKVLVHHVETSEHINAERTETSGESEFKARCPVEETDSSKEVVHTNCLKNDCEKLNSAPQTIVQVASDKCNFETLGKTFDVSRGHSDFTVGAKIRNSTELASLDSKHSESGRGVTEVASSNKCTVELDTVHCKTKERCGRIVCKQLTADSGSDDSKFVVEPGSGKDKRSASHRNVDRTQVNSVVHEKVGMRKDTEVPGLQGLVLYVEKCVKDWFTVDTLRLLLGDECVLESSKDAAVPLVDHHAQTALRRRIVLDRLNRVVPDLVAALGVGSCDVSSDMRELVSTFQLSAHNITFHMPEWNLLGLILINVASLKNKFLQQKLRSKKVKDAQAMILLSFQQDSGYLDRLICWLTEVEHQTT